MCSCSAWSKLGCGPPQHAAKVASLLSVDAQNWTLFFILRKSIKNPLVLFYVGIRRREFDPHVGSILVGAGFFVRTPEWKNCEKKTPQRVTKGHKGPCLTTASAMQRGELPPRFYKCFRTRLGCRISPVWVRNGPVRWA